MSENITDIKYQEYYFALKNVYKLHRQYGFGKSPDIPSGFSESLCRFLLGAEKGSDRTHDGITPEGKSLEIKATGTPEGKTTISNSNDFDILAWVYINFENDTASIYKLQRSLFNISGGNGRKSITLSGIVKSAGVQPTVYAFKSP